MGTLTPYYPYKFEAAPSIKTFADLKGKNIGMSTIGGAVDVATRTLLRKHGVDPDKEVTLVPDDGSQFRQQALLAGATQAAMADPPALLQLEAAGFHPLANLAAEKLPSANTGIVAFKTWVDANRPTMQKYVDALVQGMARTRADKSYSVTVAKKYFKTDDEKAMSAMYDFFAGEILPTYPYATPEQFADSFAELSKRNDKVRSLDVAKFIDSSFVKSAEDRGLAK
jgi:NitT/TauT family transport system substrate-binding protein